MLVFSHDYAEIGEFLKKALRRGIGFDLSVGGEESP